MIKKVDTSFGGGFKGAKT